MFYPDDACDAPLLGSFYRERRDVPIMPTLLVGPLAEPVSLMEAKAWLRVETTDDDDLIGALVTSARLLVEASTRRLLMAQSWRLSLDRWPLRRAIRIPLGPFAGLTAVSVLDADGVAAAVPASAYVLDASPEAARLAFVERPPLPGRQVAGIQIDATYGYGTTPTDVPEPLRLAIRILVARWYENRGDVELDAAEARLPAPVAALIAPFRRARLI